MTRYWTPRQARYTAPVVVTSTRPETPECPGCTLHFQLTVHGGVCRTWVDTDYVEVILLRHGNLHPTFQGSVRRAAGGWQAYDHEGQPLGPVRADYLDAEAPLLPRRTRQRSATRYTWPTEIRRSIR